MKATKSKIDKLDSKNLSSENSGDKDQFEGCLFCRKGFKELIGEQQMLFRSGPVAICENCVSLCHEWKAKVSTDEAKKSNKPILNITVIELANELKRYIIGQDETIDKVSWFVYHHFLSQLQNDGVSSGTAPNFTDPQKEKIISNKIKQINYQKYNLLIIGDTGSGKTLIVKHLQRILNVPTVIYDASTLTETGYVGKEPEDVLIELIEAANYNKQLAEQGIIFLDEIDKISVKGNRQYSLKEGVQHALLKILEGAEITISERGKIIIEPVKKYTINTKNIIFICSGAFIEIDLASRNAQDSFGLQVKNDVGEIQTNLEEYGLKKEFIGRFSHVLQLNKLSKEDMLIIFDHLEAKKYYELLFSSQSYRIEFSKEILDYIIHTATEQKIGARALKSCLDKVIMPYCQKYLKDIDSKNFIKYMASVKKKEPSNDLLIDLSLFSAGDLYSFGKKS